MQSRIIFLLFLFAGIQAFSQADSVKFEFGSPINDGVYLTYEDFRKNNAVIKNEIVSNFDKEQLNFIEKNLQQEIFYYQKNSTSYTIEAKKIWAYIQNNALYVNHEGEFFRVPVFGSISYLMVSVVVPNPAGVYFGAMGTTSGTNYSREIHEFLINFYDGKLVEMKQTIVEELLSRDEELFAEYKTLGKRKRKNELYLYIRKYNQRNPIYFLN